MKRFLFLLMLMGQTFVLPADVLPLRDGVLNISRRSLTALPDFTTLGARAHEVTVLDCSYNNLVELPDGALASLPNLEEVRCHNNATLVRVAATAFADNRRLRILDLREGACAELPPDLFQDNLLLEVILLGGNELTALPMVGACRHLKILEAAHNQLTVLPDCHELAQLAVLVLDHNRLAALPPALLPLEAGCALEYLLCTHNIIAELDPAFLAAVPTRGLIDLRENPCAYVASTKEGLIAAGYAEVAGTMSALDEKPAVDVAARVHADMNDKFLDFLSRSGKLAHEYPVRRLLAQRASLASLRTRLCDTIQTVQRCQYWVGIGVGVLAGGVVGYFCKKAAEKAVGEELEKKMKKAAKAAIKRIVIGGVIGGAVGAGAVALNQRYGFYAEKGAVYIDRGTGTIDVTSNLKASYRGMARLLALLSTLKQYLVAWCTYVRYIREYDSYAYGDKRLQGLVHSFEDTLHLRVRTGLRMKNEASFVAMVASLLADDPYEYMRRHTAGDMWQAAELADCTFASESEAVPLFSPDKQTLLRRVLVSFGESARMLRAALFNRYLGSDDAVAALRLRAQSEPLLSSLRELRIHLLDPLLRRLNTEGYRLAAGEEEEAGTLDEWYAEVAHLANIGRESERILGGLDS